MALYVFESLNRTSPSDSFVCDLDELGGTVCLFLKAGHKYNSVELLGCSGIHDVINKHNLFLVNSSLVLRYECSVV